MCFYPSFATDNNLKGPGCLHSLAEAAAPSDVSIAHAPCLDTLTLLNFDRNSLKGGAFQELCRACGRKGLPRLAYLNAFKCGLDCADFMALADAAKAGGLQKLYHLHIGENQINDEGFLAVAGLAAT